MWNTLPNLTRIRARGANTIGAFGLVTVALPVPTKAPFWLGRLDRVVLPGFTGRGVKYTHNDRNHTTVLTHSRGPGLCVIPQGRQRTLEVDPHHHTR